MVRYTPILLACLLGSSAAGLTPSLKRSDQQVSKDGTLRCGNFGSASKHTSPNLLRDLSTGGSIATKLWTIKGGQCHRVHCYDTSGVYVCNDHKKEMKIAGHMIAKGLKCITDNCCRDDWDSRDNYQKGQSGQKFYRGMESNFNIVLAYGNCGHDANVKPHDEGGWNVNPVCMGGVMVPDYDGCSAM